MNARDAKAENEYMQSVIDKYKSRSPMNTAQTKPAPGFYNNKQAIAKIDELKAELAKVKNESATLKTQLASARAVASSKARSTANAPAASAAGLTTAEAFGTKPLAMSRAEFGKLSPADKSRFSKNGGTIK